MSQRGARLRAVDSETRRALVTLAVLWAFALALLVSVCVGR